MIEKNILIDGKETKLRCSALLPRLYRAKFGRDMVTDMRQLAKAYKTANDPNLNEEERQEAAYKMLDLEIFENVAWLMQKTAGGEVGESPEEWLDNLDGIFSVYEVMPAILELWAASNKTTSEPRKK